MGEDKQTNTTFELLNQGSRPFLRCMMCQKSGTLTLSVIYKTILLEWKRKIYIFAGNFYSINAIKVLNFTQVL